MKNFITNPDRVIWVWAIFAAWVVFFASTNNTAKIILFVLSVYLFLISVIATYRVAKESSQEEHVV